MNKQVEKDSSKATSKALALIASKDIGLQDFSENVSQEYALWVRALLQNWRQGTVGCKARSDVAYTNKKPWKQKGTGRARAGSARSPLWRGGGVTFGPQARTKTLKVNKKTKGRVLSALVNTFAEHKKLHTLDWQLDKDMPSTSLVQKALQAAQLHDKKVTLFLHRDDVNHWMSVRNIANIQIISFDDVNAYDLSLGNCVVILKKDYDMFKDMVKKWN